MLLTRRDRNYISLIQRLEMVQLGKKFPALRRLRNHFFIALALGSNEKPRQQMLIGNQGSISALPRRLRLAIHLRSFLNPDARNAVAVQFFHGESPTFVLEMVA